MREILQLQEEIIAERKKQEDQIKAAMLLQEE
jgi:hypothetical protein